jgi:hypothetical protein
MLGVQGGDDALRICVFPNGILQCCALLSLLHTPPDPWLVQALGFHTG